MLMGICRRYLTAILGGVLRTPQGECAFRASSGTGEFTATFAGQDPSNAARQERIFVLRILGDTGSLSLVTQPHLDWELRAADPPYDGLGDALGDVQLGSFRTDASSVELVAFNAAVVNLASAVKGKKAALTVHLALGLDPKLVTLGYRVYSRTRSLREHG
jgi:hypothetical protein